MKYLIIILFVAMNSNASSKKFETLQQQNIKIVTAFCNLAFNQHQPLEAAKLYLAENYIQHNPHVADGRQGFIDAFNNEKTNDTSTTEFKRFIAQDDLVVVHSHGKQNPTDRGVAVIDIFRVEGNQITEHWDVGQKVPENPKNKNTMF
jgi:predicted SnoaL-like aldol condensation-catalyzing enzyme